MPKWPGHSEGTTSEVTTNISLVTSAKEQFPNSPVVFQTGFMAAKMCSAACNFDFLPRASNLYRIFCHWASTFMIPNA